MFPGIEIPHGVSALGAYKQPHAEAGSHRRRPL